MNLQKSLDDKLKAEQDSRKDRQRSGLFSPSSLGKCYRAQIWNRRNETPSNPVDARTLRVFKAGNLFHDFVQSLIDCDCEVEVKSEDFYGRADCVTKDMVIDLKSQHSRAFWYMKKEGYDVYKEKESNWLQVACYAWLLKKPKISVAFISKDDVCINQYVSTTDKWIDKLQKELDLLKMYWGDTKLPPAEPRCYNGKECQYCNYRDKCKEIENGSK